MGAINPGSNVSILATSQRGRVLEAGRASEHPLSAPAMGRNPAFCLTGKPRMRLLLHVCSLFPSHLLHRQLHVLREDLVFSFFSFVTLFIFYSSFFQVVIY